MSHNCNDYIFKNGKFIRDFEGMYKNFDDPWNQEENHKKEYGPNLALNAIQIALHNLGKSIDKVLDIGCANGYYAPILLNMPSKEYLGVDVSETIIQKAKNMNNDKRASFKKEELLTEFSSSHENQYDLIFCAATLYYVAPEILNGNVLENIFKYCKKDGVFSYVYNYRPGKSLTEKVIKFKDIREKLKDYFSEIFFSEIQLIDKEIVAIGILQKKL